MGHCAAGWIPLDSGLLGLGRWRLHLAPRVLGTTDRCLWRTQLRLPRTIVLSSRRQVTEGRQLPLRLSRSSLADAMSWPHARRLRMAVPASARRLPPLRLAVKDGLLHESKIEAKVPQGMPAPMSRGLNVRPSGTLSPSSPGAIGN